LSSAKRTLPAPSAGCRRVFFICSSATTRNALSVIVRPRVANASTTRQKLGDEDDADTIPASNSGLRPSWMTSTLGRRVMAFHDRQYQCYLVLGDPAAPPIWNWSRWLGLAQAFDPVVKLCRDKPLLRVGQFTKEKKRKEVKFGRLVWSHDSFAKWTHGSSITAATAELWDFYYVEVSAPSLPVAGREGKPPDFFFVVANEGLIGRELELAFNPTVIVSIASDMPKEALVACGSAIEHVQGMVASRLSAKIVRPWGYSVGSLGGFQDAIQDIAYTGLFKVGQRHARPLDLETLAQKWEALR